ncbi:MAG: amidase [Pseudomonadota bacterium]
MADINPDQNANRRGWDRHLHAFADLREGLAPTEPGASQLNGALSGTIVGVKDIIDVAGMPTRNGSATCADAPAATEDAPVVAALRQAGAHIIGKTVTTEFAFTDPTDCRNPHDLSRSPGGSSSGSGAAVGAGLVDLALGTQTAGSLCRPAAYCGAVGFKPGYGILPTRGVTPLAPSFDTVGIIARSVDLAARAFDAMCPNRPDVDTKRPEDCAGCRMLLDFTTPIAPETEGALNDAAERLGQVCGAVAETPTSVDAETVVADHRIVMNHEAYMAHGHLLRGDRADLLRPKFRAALQAGAAIPTTEAADALLRLDGARDTFWAEMGDTDILLTLPVPDGAPKMGETTGFQYWLTCWTVFRGPLISLPWGLDSLGRPRAVMLAAKPGAEATLLAVAAALEGLAPPLPAPQLPD